MCAEEARARRAVFTTNQVAAAPVNVSRRHIATGTARAVVINAGNANACTGAQGERDAESTAQAVADALGCEPSDVLVCSTGVIGVPLPVDRVLDGYRRGRRSSSTAETAAPQPRRS